mgnify:CR=1 FL=1
MSVHLLLGDDGGLLSTTLSDLVHRLVGDEDRSLMVDSFDSEDYVMSTVIDAAQTAPFLTERRVVVARGMGRFGSDELGLLVRYLEDPLDTTDLVLVPGGKLAKSVVDAVKKAGGVVIDTAPPTGKKDRAAWVEQQFDEAGMNVDASAMFLVKDWLGEDAGRLRSLIEVLESTYGRTRTLKSADIAVAYDDLTIDLGLVKVSVSGSAGGHNGVASLLEHVGDNFVRFRLGIGPKQPTEITLADFVLGKFTPEQSQLVSQLTSSYLAGLELLLQRGIEPAMNQLNRRATQ